MTREIALQGYRREWLRPDVIAGLTAAAVVVPKAMAYATIAALPVQVGLYTALVPMVIYAVLGTSRPLSVSTTTTIAILTGSAAATLAVMVGLVLLAAWVLRLGFVAAMPAGGGTSQTAINRLAGARSQAAELVTAAGALATVLLLAPTTRWMPQAALAAVVIWYSLELIQPRQFLAIRRVRTTEFRWSVIALAGVMFLGTLQGIVVAVIDSLLSLANQAYNPPLYAVARKRGTAVFRPISPEHPNDESWAGVLLLKIEGRLFFANAQRVADLIRSEQQRTRAQVLVIDCSAVIDVEYTALKVLEQLDDKLRRNGCELCFAGMTRAVFEVVERSGIGSRIGHERMFLNLQAAVEAYERRGGHEPIEEGATGHGREAPQQA